MVEPIRWGFGPTGFADSGKAQTISVTNWSANGKPQTPAELTEALQGAKVKPLITAAAVLKTMARDDLASELINVVAAELADDGKETATNSGGLSYDL